jgi:hypothetical protein
MKITQIVVAVSAMALLVGCTSTRQQFGYARPVKFDQMPQAAQATVRNEVGDRTIKRITEETKYGRPTYRVEVEEPWINSALWVAPNGAVVKESSRLVAQRQVRTVNEAAGAQPSAGAQAPSSAAPSSSIQNPENPPRSSQNP